MKRKAERRQKKGSRGENRDESREETEGRRLSMLLLLLLLLFNSMPHREMKTMERLGQNETFWNRYLIGMVRAV